MTIPMDCAISYTAGSIFAAASGEAIAEDRDKEKEFLNRGRIFTALVTLPIGYYFYKRWPDWSWMYTIGGASSNPAMGAVGLAGYAIAHELGFRSTARLVKAGHKGRALGNILLGAVSFLMVVVLGWNRFRWQGTTSEYESGEARDALLCADFMVPLGVAMVTFALGTLALLILNRRHEG